MSAQQDMMAMMTRMAKEMGMELVPATPAPKKSRRAGNKAKAPAMHQAVSMPAPPVAAPQKAQKPKAFYGQAPSVKSTGTIAPPTAAMQTHLARKDALETAIPGITSIAHVFSVGKNVQKKLETSFALMVNTPFTYIELPGGKDQTVGNLTPNEVRAKIKACGYGFTKQKAADGSSRCYWGCDSNGRPVRRQYGDYAKQNAAANCVGGSDDQ